MGLISNIESLFDKASKNLEKQRDIKKFKKLAEEYEFPEILTNQFLESFQLLKEECISPKNKLRRKKLTDTANFSEVKFTTLFLLRAYQLTNEFIHATTHQLTHSSVALTRSMYELLVTIIYAKHNLEVMDIITSEKEGKEKGVGDMIKELRQKKIKFFVTKITEGEKYSKVDILPELYEDYRIFSNLMHSFKKETYHSNLTHSLDTGKDEAIILGNWFLQYPEKRVIATKFASYVILSVRELKIMKSKLYTSEDDGPATSK